MQKQSQISSANMSNFVILSFAVLCLAEPALNLTCYTSDFSSFMSGNIQNLTYKLQDCFDFIDDMPSIRNPVTGNLRCFTISADYLDVVFKGCIPEGNCDSMTKAFRQMVQTSGAATADAIGNVDCRECDEDKCNEDNTLTLSNNFTWDAPIPETSTASSTRVAAVDGAENHQSAVKLKRAYIYLLLYSGYLCR